MKEKTTFLAKASMMLFAVLFSLAANSAETAGVTLPYEYGFENNALDIEGWTKENRQLWIRVLLQHDSTAVSHLSPTSSKWSRCNCPFLLHESRSIY